MARLFKRGLEACDCNWLRSREVQVSHNLLHMSKTRLALNSFGGPSEKRLRMRTSLSSLEAGPRRADPVSPYLSSIFFFITMPLARQVDAGHLRAVGWNPSIASTICRIEKIMLAIKFITDIAVVGTRRKCNKMGKHIFRKSLSFYYTSRCFVFNNLKLW